MIYREKIRSAFESRSGDFISFDSESAVRCQEYRAALERLMAEPAADLLDRLAKHEHPGAVPLEDFSTSDSGIFKFNHSWNSHEQARDWAYKKLLGRTTFAADGSQIIPTKDFSIPVAAVQVGWFENPHRPDGSYIKDALFDILPPGEIIGSSGTLGGISEQAVHRRRYAMEVEAITSYMSRASAAGVTPDSPPVVFFDSLLVISFADAFPPDQRQFYVSRVTSLLESSDRSHIPLVGFVDGSYARDLTMMLQTAADLPDSHKVSDAGLLSPLMKWGDRTPFYRCARQGILQEYPERWRKGVGFLYLKTAADAPPARLDIPVWVYESGLLDYVVDIVRAEVIAGNGYPYALETADATAVLSVKDRELFYSMFQEFAQQQKLSFRTARKALSKAHRR